MQLLHHDSLNLTIKSLMKDSPLKLIPSLLYYFLYALDRCVICYIYCNLPETGHHPILRQIY